MEARTPVIAKKLCKMVRVILFMIQKGVTKTKMMLYLRLLMKRGMMLDLHLLTKRGKIIGKALNDAMLHHYSTISCRSNDMHHASFVCRREYEFSCSNSPAFQPYIPFHVNRRKSFHHKRQTVAVTTVDTCDIDDEAVASDADVADVSPLVGPVRRWVRVTDSPFPLWDDDKDCHVDKEAEEFIQRFYKQLRLQKPRANI